jgi:hypothetical protein
MITRNADGPEYLVSCKLKEERRKKTETARRKKGTQMEKQREK